MSASSGQIVVSLPSGEKRTVAKGTSAREVLPIQKNIVAARVNGKVVDLSSPLEEDAKIEPVLLSTPEGLDVLRHSCAHLMAQAVKRLFPDVQITIGPVIENGFYYDFKHERAFTPEDLEK
ncbi:MAG: TGS domain-containing protein, partial [Candidatus Binatia bacterium]